MLRLERASHESRLVLHIDRVQPGAEPERVTRVGPCLESHLVNTKLHLDPNGRCKAGGVNGRRGTNISYYHRIMESGYAFKEIGLIDVVIYLHF